MKSKLYKTLMIFLLAAGAGSFLTARGPDEGADHERGLIRNEDLRFILEWERNTKIHELAGQLALTAEQVTALREVKTEVEAIRADLEQRKAALQEQVASTAAEARTRIEAEGVFSEEDKALLRSLREQGRDLRKEGQMRFSLATMGLRNILTEEQKQIMAQSLRREPGNDRGRYRRRGTARGTRILLSDAFLRFYD